MDSGRKGVAPGCGGAVGALLLLLAHGTAAPSLPLSLIMMISLAVLALARTPLVSLSGGSGTSTSTALQWCFTVQRQLRYTLTVQRVSAWLANALLQPQQQQAAGSFMLSFALIRRHPRTLRVNRSHQPMTS